jgi:hypothetical protein
LKKTRTSGTLVALGVKLREGVAEDARVPAAAAPQKAKPAAKKGGAAGRKGRWMTRIAASMRSVEFRILGQLVVVSTRIARLRSSGIC